MARRSKKNPHAVALGRLGGKMRAAVLSPEERSRISSLAAQRKAELMSAEDREELASRAGLKGGKARAAKLTPEQRKEIAKKAAAVRWSKRNRKS